MANTFYPRQTVATAALFTPRLARFLINDLFGFTGPGWSVIDTYSSAAASPFEVPADPHNMDSLAADNGWRTGTIVAGDYIILQSVSVAGFFQLGIEYHAGWEDNIRFIGAPYGGFDVTAFQPDMTNAANWTLPRISTIDVNTSTGGVPSINNYTIYTESDRMFLVADSHPSYRALYAGKLLDTYTGDNNSLVMNVFPSNCWLGNGTQFNRISPVDNTTEIGVYVTEPSGNACQANYLRDTASGLYRLIPTELIATAGGHTSMPGKLDGIYMSNANIIGSPNRGSLGSLAYYAWHNNAGSSPWIINWDGVTP